MSERLAAATVRAEEQQAQRAAAAAASTALTSVMPAINHPLTVPADGKGRGAVRVTAASAAARVLLPDPGQPATRTYQALDAGGAARRRAPG